MKEDVLKLGTLLLILTPGRHGSFRCYQIKKECFVMSEKSARIKKLAVMAMFTAIAAVLITLVDKICATAEAMHIWRKSNKR